MAMDAWLEVKEQVRQAVDIVELVGSYLELRRQGRDYVGLCPFHDDTRPSMHVNPERQFYKCFVCDSGGDIFSFVMQREGLEFREALELLADRAAVRLPAAPQPAATAGTPQDKRTLYAAVAWAEGLFHRYLLDAPAAEPARRYLAERKISPESIARFRLGFAPDRWDFLTKRAGADSFSLPVLEKVGLVAQKNEGDHYDRFRGRVIFPIREPVGKEGRPIAFGGRILPELADERSAKYYNSPETPLFSKHEQFYGLDLARDTVIHNRHAIVVEGYTDCLAAHQEGVFNVIAVLGTALGERHVQLLRRYADTITLVLDGDEAGRRRTNQILKLFVAAQVDLRILTLPQNVDPCDFLQTQGGEAFGQLVAGAVDALEHQLQTVTEGLDITSDTHQANQALEQVLLTMAGAPRLAATTASAIRLREEQLLARLSRRFGPPEEDLRRRLGELRRPASSARHSVASSSTAERPVAAWEDLDFWDRELLELIVTDPSNLARISSAIEPSEVRSPAARAIYGRCLARYRAGAAADFDRLMLEAEEPWAKNLLVSLLEQSRVKEEADQDRRLEEVLRSFQRRKEDTEHHHAVAALREEANPDSEALLAEALAALRSRHQRPKLTDG